MGGDVEIMGFDWKCPECELVNYYSGSKTTNVVVQCKSCKRKIKASSHKIVKKPLINYQKQPETTKKLPPLKFNGMVQSLIIALNYAINTIKNKEEVIAKKEDSTWYAHYKSWTRIREYLQALEEDK